MKKVKPVYLGGLVNLCQYCKHLDDGMRCKAYPMLIPLEIRWMNVDHRQPYLGDNGVQFELRQDMDPFSYEMFLKEQVSDRDAEKYESMVEQILGKQAQEVIDAARRIRENSRIRSEGGTVE